MPKLKVFGVRLSPFVEKVVRGLQLKRIDYELVPPRSPRDLRRWNALVASGKLEVHEDELDGRRPRRGDASVQMVLGGHALAETGRGRRRHLSRNDSAPKGERTRLAYRGRHEQTLLHPQHLARPATRHLGGSTPRPGKESSH